jgi:hypothetical protein
MRIFNYCHLRQVRCSELVSDLTRRGRKHPSNSEFIRSGDSSKVVDQVTGKSLHPIPFDGTLFIRDLTAVK